MSRGHRSFFWRLLYAFFAGGLVPFILLAVVFATASTQILENAWRDRTGEAIHGAAELSRQLLADAASTALTLASSEPVKHYMTVPVKDAWLVSEINRLFSSVVSTSSFEAFLVPLDGSEPLSRTGVPDEYRHSLYGSWSILGELSRKSPKHENPDGSIGLASVVFYGQPHPSSGLSIPVSAGIPVYTDGRLSGYVIIDIGRQAFSDQVGSVASAGGALTNLFISDRNGCILYNLGDGQIESGFVEALDADDGDFFMSSEEVRHGISVTGKYPVHAVRSYSSRIAATAVLIASLSMLVSFAMAILLSRSISRPVHLLTLTMERVSQGQLDARCEELPGKRSGDELAVLIRRFNSMIDQVNDLVGNLVAQERELRRAETRALQAQINPHFLYNTLNSIRSIARLQGASEIADMTTSLARIMREGSYPGTGFCSVSHSLDIARDYFAIESARWPGRFELRENVTPEVLGARIPRLIVQPVVENALVHGLEEKPGNGVLSITGQLVAGDVILTVHDTGVGISASRLAEVKAILEEAGARPVESSLNGAALDVGSGGEGKLSGTGIALVNTHRRLSLVYGLPYGIEISSEGGNGTTVTICFPYASQEES